MAPSPAMITNQQMILPLSGDEADDQDEPPEHPCDEDDYGTLIDRSHGVLSRGVCWPTRWLDHFFADDDILSLEPGTRIRIIGGQGWQDNGDHFGDSRISAKLMLPYAQNRLSLLFFDDEEDDDDTRSARTSPSDRSGFQGALRWAARTTDRINLDFDAGLTSSIKVFTRVRYRYQKPVIDDRTRFRLTQEGRWRDGQGWRSRSRFEFDRGYTEVLSARLTTQFEISEINIDEGRDWHIFQGVSLFRRLGERSGINLYANVEGFTEPVAAVESWTTGLRFRRDIWRKWLYYEVEPFITWPREEDFRRITGIVLRLEVQLGLVD